IINALSVCSALIIRNGFVNTNDQAVNTRYLFLEIVNNGGMTLGSSTITLTGAPFFLNGNTNFFFTTAWIRPTGGTVTIDAGTSLFDLTSPFAQFKVDASNLAFNDLTFSSPQGSTQLDLIGGDNNSFNNITANSNSTFIHEMYIENLSLTPGKSYTFNSVGRIFSFGNIDAIGDCTMPIVIRSIVNNIRAVFSSENDIVLDFISLKDLEFTGGGSMTVNNATDLGNNVGLNINAKPIADLYWVGNSGNWDDPIHWSFTSGGAGGACVPSGTDNVIFDENSFTLPNQTVTVNVEDSYCRDMIWTNVTNQPTFTGSFNLRLHINGSLAFSRNMNMNYGGSYLFEGSNMGQTITMAGQMIPSIAVFEGTNGEWILQDSFIVNLDIELVSGTLRTNDQYVESHRFTSFNLPNRGLFLGSSTWVLHPSGFNIPQWQMETDNITFDAGTSTIHFIINRGLMSNVGNAPLEYHKVIFDNESSISGSGGLTNKTSFDTVDFRHNGFIYVNIKFGALKLTTGHTYTFGVQTEQEIDTIMGNGGCDGMITLKSLRLGSKADLMVNRDHTLERYVINDVHSVGPGQMTANNSIDLGNTDGWTINELVGRDLYWVGDTGDWEDPANWSLTSGGPGGECIPTLADNVFFDENSFAGPNSTVTGSRHEIYYCNNMTWSNIPNNTTISAITMNIYGNLDLAPSTTNFLYNVGFTVFRGMGDHTITSNGTYIPGVGVECSGAYTMTDNLITNGMTFYSGVFNTNDFDLTAFNITFLTFESPMELNLGSSHIFITGVQINNIFPFRIVTSFPQNLTINAGTSLIEFTNPETGMYIYKDFRFHNILFSSTEGRAYISVDQSNNINEQAFFNRVQFNNDGLIEGWSYFDSLYFAPGKSYELESNVTQEIGSHFQIVGNNCNPIELSSTLPGVSSTVTMASGIVNGDFIQMQDQVAQGGADFFAGVHSTDIGNSNTGWVFETRETFTEVGFL
ncbi:MAG: hypothetical protein AAFO07_29035, partial [Bacteroidota bacterium]